MVVVNEMRGERTGLTDGGQNGHCSQTTYYLPYAEKKGGTSHEARVRREAG